MSKHAAAPEAIGLGKCWFSIVWKSVTQGSVVSCRMKGDQAPFETPFIALMTSYGYILSGLHSVAF